ncbi:MAG: RHS repeat-associated core domain-containing protein [Limisphaerales bacterium]
MPPRARTFSAAAARKIREAEQAKASQLATRHASPATPPQEFFYTGKPYLEETGQYLFLFRHYDPDLARWTVQDFAGFLDGPNNYKYAPTPTSSFDFLGLLDWTTLQATGVTDTSQHPTGYSWDYEIYTIKTDDHNHTIQMWKNLQPWDKPGGTANCHGFTFASGQYWIQPEWVVSIISGDGYKLITGSNNCIRR